MTSTPATRGSVSSLGTIIGAAGIEHGIGEMLQGNVAPNATVIESWPDSEAFRILAGEPALTIVPNLLVTGALAVLVSLAFITVATAFPQRERAGLALMLLSLVMLLLGGGFGPPLMGLMLGGAATQIEAPPERWRKRLPPGLRIVLARLWPWLLVLDVGAWLALFPGVVLLAALVGVDDVPAAPVYALIATALGLLPVTAVAAFARDATRANVAGAPR